MNPGSTEDRRESGAMESRAKDLQKISQGTLDLLVIGGGIVGAGVARDAAMRGLRVGLAEQYDFAFGTSSRSSRLLHGGLRYLAQGRLGLVREASIEKRILHRIAPHLAQPLPFLFPAYAGTQWPLWQMRLGVKLYDLLCNGKNFGKSKSLSRSELLAQIPQLASEGLKGGVRYFDAFTNDARLVLDTLRSAVVNGAIILNYAKLKTAKRDSGHWTCELNDQISGQKWVVKARAILNATGPWAELLPHSSVKLRLTKGVHVVIERAHVPTSEAIAITQGRRLVFILPWGERLIVGTTDTDYSNSLDDVRPSAEDIDYVLSAVNQYFPRAALSRSHVLSAWAGLRPLIAEPNGAPSEIPRSHQLRNPEPGWWDLAGGKLTTYRLMAEQTVDEIIQWLKRTAGVEAGPCQTAEQPLLSSGETQGISGILPPEFRREAVEHYCSNEWAIHLEDVMWRRTGWQHYLQNVANKAEQVADWMQPSLGWSSETRAAELKRYHQNARE
jgi:glycerol-3-phosphate dehydrogenase